MFQFSMLTSALRTAFGHQPVGRPARKRSRGVFIEPVEGRLLLSATLPGSEALFAADSAAAIVVTNKLGYAPGETAVIIGSGFQAGEAVLQVARGDGAVYGGWSVVDGSANDLDGAVNGSIKTSWVLPGDAPGNTFQAQATGAASSLFGQTSFNGDRKSVV